MERETIDATLRFKPIRFDTNLRSERERAHVPIGVEVARTEKPISSRNLTNPAFERVFSVRQRASAISRFLNRLSTLWQATSAPTKPFNFRPHFAMSSTFSRARERADPQPLYPPYPETSSSPIRGGHFLIGLSSFPYMVIVVVRGSPPYPDRGSALPAPCHPPPGVKPHFACNFRKADYIGLSMDAIRRPHSHMKMAYIRILLADIAACRRDLKTRRAHAAGPAQDAVYATFGRAVWKLVLLAEPHLEECHNPGCVQQYVSKGWFSRQRYCSQRCADMHSRKTHIFEERIRAAETRAYATEAVLKKEDEIEYEEYEGDAGLEGDDGE